MNNSKAITEPIIKFSVSVEPSEGRCPPGFKPVDDQVGRVDEVGVI